MKEIQFDPEMKQLIIELCKKEFEKDQSSPVFSHRFKEENVFH